MDLESLGPSPVLMIILGVVGAAIPYIWFTCRKLKLPAAAALVTIVCGCLVGTFQAGIFAYCLHNMVSGATQPFIEATQQDVGGVLAATTELESTGSWSTLDHDEGTMEHDPKLLSARVDALFYDFFIFSCGAIAAQPSEAQPLRVRRDLSTKACPLWIEKRIAPEIDFPTGAESGARRRDGAAVMARAPAASAGR
eukprot:COSAG06_NODE_1728_length_8567_cov_5.090222_1_plen_195_part_10